MIAAQLDCGVDEASCAFGAGRSQMRCRSMMWLKRWSRCESASSRCSRSCGDAIDSGCGIVVGSGIGRAGPVLAEVQ